MSHPIDPQILAGITLLGFFSACLLNLSWRRLVTPAEPGARRLGPYTLADKIGQGAMGEVYRARHELLGRWCAIKLLSGDVTERELTRFEREIRSTARLSHPNTVSIFDCGRAADGTLYYAMELLDGMSLQELVDKHGPLPPGRVIHVLLQLCAALSEAHRAGLVHRDIKPDNIVLCRQGGADDVTKLLDFGLVKEIDGEPEASRSVNLLIGTPLYISPEAIVAPQTVSARSDLYALGAVAYFLLSGRPVFEGESLIDVCSQHLHSAPEPLSRVTSAPIAADLERIVLDCLAKDPHDRPASAAELAQRLEQCADAGSGHSPKTRTPRHGAASVIRRLDRLESVLEQGLAAA
jgi:serine/threonine-protein kinase